MKLFFKLDNVRYMQYLSTTIASLAMTSVGTYTAWASPVLPQLTSKKSPIGITITANEGSWVISSLLLGCIMGCVFPGWLVENIGRKKTLLVSAIPLTIPWIAIVFAKSTYILYIARFCAGLGLPIVVASVSIYNGEISDKDIRGKLGTIYTISNLVGHCFVLSVGPFLSYTTFALSCIAFPLVFVILFCFMPESPYYLIKVQKEVEARRNLVKLSSNSTSSYIIEQRLDEIKASIAYDMKNKSTMWELFSKQEYKKSLIVMTGIASFQQLCGTTAFESYTQTIIESSETSISPKVSSIICGVIKFPSAFLAASLVDRMGRKPLMIVSCIGCAIALIAEGVYFYLLNTVKANVSEISWLPTTALLLFLLMNALGLSSLPLILLGEMFATNIKGIAVATFLLYGTTLSFVVTKLFQPISDEWGMHVMFWIFASACILGALFGMFVLLETKGKTFSEIQETFNQTK